MKTLSKLFPVAAAALALLSLLDARAADVKRPVKMFHLYVNDGEWEFADGKKTYIVSYVAYNDKFEEAPRGPSCPTPDPGADHPRNRGRQSPRHPTQQGPPPPGPQQRLQERYPYHSLPRNGPRADV